MNPNPEPTPHLKQLRLSGILDSLEARNRQALDCKLAYTEFLSLLIQDEVARREQKKFQTRLRRGQIASHPGIGSLRHPPGHRCALQHLCPAHRQPQCRSRHRRLRPAPRHPRAHLAFDHR